MKSLLMVFLGGGLGSVLRYAISLILHPKPNSFPINTFIVNVLGCLLIGFLTAYFIKIEQTFTRLLLITGFCGGFTTFSSFSNETLELLKSNQYSLAFIYILVSIFICLLATFIGYTLTTKIL